jgi:uncharacterized integral membrane protein
MTQYGQAQAPQPRWRMSPKWIAAALIAIAAIWFIVANNQSAQISLWVKSVQAPVWLVLALTFAAGMLTGWLLRRRRVG